MDEVISESADDAPEEKQPLHPLLEQLRSFLISKLTDTSRNNGLLYYRDLKASRLELPSIADAVISGLIAGELVTRESLGSTPVRSRGRSAAESNESEQAEDQEGEGSLFGFARPTRALDPLTRKLKTIRDKARENLEERGLETLFAGLGMLSWRAHDGGKDPLALLFLLPVEIVDDPKARGEHGIRRTESGDGIFNPALFEALPPALVARFRTMTDEGVLDDFDTALTAVKDALLSFPEIEFRERCVLGTFSTQRQAMVDDLQQADDLLAESSVVLAIAGDEEAQAELSEQRDGVVAVNELDAIPARDEQFILDADPWQAQTLHTLLKYEESSAVIDGPPGTGKSQTIANAIAALMASGKSVLFVAEKRAALDVVHRRLTACGLGSLVLDLHGADVTRKRVYGLLKNAAYSLQNAPPPHGDDNDRTFEDRRRRLNEHSAFANGPLLPCGLTTVEVMGRLAVLPGAPALRTRLVGDELDKLTPVVVECIKQLLTEAATQPDVFTRADGVAWSRANLHSGDEADRAFALVTKLRDDVLPPLRREFDRLVPTESRNWTVDEFLAAAHDLVRLLDVLAMFRPGIAEMNDDVLNAAIAATQPPFASLLWRFSARQKNALREVRSQLISADTGRSDANARLRELRALPANWRRAAAQVGAVSRDEIVNAMDAFAPSRTALEALLGASLPTDISAFGDELNRLARERLTAFRVIRMREVERNLRERGAGRFIDELPETRGEASAWADAFERVWLSSHLDRIMPQLASFNGRSHDRVVEDFCRTDRARMKFAQQRVLRAVAIRRATVIRDAKNEQTAIDVQLSKQRPRKPLRDLFTEAPNALTAMCPCVMASPLSVSQFLPRARIFDVVIFDEGSQVAPETAITSIMRGKRLVVAGDQFQLPPTSFFQAIEAEDEGDDDAPIASVQSILDLVKPFVKPLGLRVHYRSNDERLIAFSNHHIYSDRLVTFPGTGLDGKAVSHVLADGAAGEGEELSSSDEVLRVVDLIIEHAETRPHESLGVIAMNINHARRIQVELERVGKERPDLDAFFDEKAQDAFFIKNLERVQGDERDAIILSIGYGRTKTGAVRHNFGPVNVQGGERRLNVAITRAKNRITLVSSFRSSDLDPQKLKSRGAQLLGAYLKFAESGGENLGRDRPHEEIALNDFEADIKATLERELQISIVPQVGFGEFRIDLAVQHPDRPGTYVLAIECDGATYHSSPTARMRDRLRQQILEEHGWRFCRIWSTDWFLSRNDEIARVKAAYRAALLQDDAEYAVVREHVPTEPVIPEPAFFARRGSAPVRRGTPIGEISNEQFERLLVWIDSDGRVRTDDQLFDAAVEQLGYARRGKNIVAGLTAAIGRYRQNARVR